MIDYSDLYDKLVSKWPNIEDYVDKKDIIHKTKSKSHNFNPNKGTKEIIYIATVMKGFLAYDYKKNLDRIKKSKNRIKKLNQLGIY